MEEPTPTISGIYVYLLGGEEYNEADKQVGEFYRSLIPSISKWLLMVRDYLPAAAHHLKSLGVTHVVDFASGIPVNHLDSVLSDAKIVYSDIDPSVLEDAKPLIDGNPNILYVQHDVKEPLSLVHSEQVKAFLGDSIGQLAIGLSGISVFIPPDELKKITSALYDWAPEGTLLFSQFETKAGDKITPQFEQFLGAAEQSGNPYYLYSVEEVHEAVSPWKIETMTPLAEFIGREPGFITEADREGVDLEFYAVIAKK